MTSFINGVGQVGGVVEGPIIGILAASLGWQGRVQMDKAGVGLPVECLQRRWDAPSPGGAQRERSHTHTTNAPFAHMCTPEVRS